MVYEGTEPYLFVSYAHKDGDFVLPIIETMQSKGFRVWYDSGIEAGSEWPEYIAEHLESSACVIAFVSEASAKSHNCRSEISYAIELEKELLVAYIEEAELSSGMKMRLHALQFIDRRNFDNDDSFIAALAEARILARCKAENTADNRGTTSSTVASATSPSARKHYDLGLAYYYGRGVERDYLTALGHVDEALSMGLDEERSAELKGVLPRLCYWAGRQCADSADGTKSRLAQAVAYFERSADLGDPYGTCELGRYYRDGRGVPADPVKAFELSKAAAEMGDFGGNYDIGLCYAKGIGVSKDFSLAAGYYEAAASCEPSSPRSKGIALQKAIEAQVQAGNHAEAKRLMDSIKVVLADSDDKKDSELLKKVEGIALDSIEVKAVDYTIDFLNKSDSAMSMYSTEEGVVVYDMDISREAISAGSRAYLSSVGDSGLRYILENGYPNKTYRNNKGMDAYITQMAIWWYLSESLSTDFRYADETIDQYNLVPVARKLVENARLLADSDSSEPHGQRSKTVKIYSTDHGQTTRLVGLFDTQTKSEPSKLPSSPGLAKQLPPKITIKRADILKDYLTNGEYGFTVITDTECESILYSLDVRTQHPFDGEEYILSDESDLGLSYILQNGAPNKVISGGLKTDICITQAAIYWYFDPRGFGKTMEQVTQATDINRFVPKYIEPLVKSSLAATEGDIGENILIGIYESKSERAHDRLALLLQMP